MSLSDLVRRQLVRSNASSERPHGLVRGAYASTSPMAARAVSVRLEAKNAEMELRVARLLDRQPTPPAPIERNRQQLAGGRRIFHREEGR